MRRSYRPVIALAFVLLALVPATTVNAAEGTIVNDKGEAIEGARVCFYTDGVELLCVLTDDQGRYLLPGSTSDTLRAHAEGYNPVTFSAAGVQAPVVLQQAPTLIVRLSDRADGERLSEGEVLISNASGKEWGPFPVNQAGLRIRRGLSPGLFRIVGRAEGYEPSKPREVTLKSGDETSVTIALDAVEKKTDPE